ncbi:MAG: acylphosphatase [Coriobacteriia bacterium]
MGQRADRTRAHVRIAGRVQGVFFRATIAEEARSVGVDGWVRNAGDGVEAVFEGPKPLVERMVAWAHVGPPSASVEHVSVEWGLPEGISGFGVR